MLLSWRNPNVKSNTPDPVTTDLCKHLIWRLLYVCGPCLNSSCSSIVRRTKQKQNIFHFWDTYPVRKVKYLRATATRLQISIRRERENSATVQLHFQVTSYLLIEENLCVDPDHYVTNNLASPVHNIWVPNAQEEVQNMLRGFFNF